MATTPSTPPRYRPLQPATATRGAMQPPGPPQIGVPDEPVAQPTQQPAVKPPPSMVPGEVGATPTATPPASHPPGTTHPTATNPILPPTGHPVTGETPIAGTTPTTVPKPKDSEPVAKPLGIAPTTSPVGNALRGETYLPGDDPRLKGAMTATDRAGAAVQGFDRAGMQAGNENRYRSIYGDGNLNPSDFAVNTDVRFRGLNPNIQGGASVDPLESARTAQYGSAQDAALDAINGAPSRTELAMQKLKDFDAVSAEQEFNESRNLGRNIAKFGRSGMQSNADDFGEITRKIAADRGRLKNDLVASVAEGDTNDRFRRLDSVSGLRGQESALDAGRRGEQRTERDYTTGLSERNYGRAADERDLETALDESNIGRRMSERDTRLGVATGNQDRNFARTNAALNYAGNQTDRAIGDTFDQFDAAGSLEDRIFGQGQSNRNEFRTERGREDVAAQQTIENRLREFELQQQLEDQRLRRAAYLTQAGGGY